MKIENVKARQVLDSRGNPTVEAEISTSKDSFRAIVPSGASTGKHEALEMRDGEKAYSGKGVLKAVSNVNSFIAKEINGKKFASQKELDSALLSLDGTENKSKLGANALLGVSMAFTRALAVENNLELFEQIGEISKNKNFVLPVPQLNVLNGGKHAGKESDIQEHMLFPIGFDSFSEALQAGTETYHLLKKKLKAKYGAQATLLGDEGGFVPPIGNVNDRLELMLSAVEEAGYAGKIKIGLDCASSEFLNNGKYSVGEKTFSSGELVDFYAELVDKFDIVSIEDGMGEDDWEGWSALTKSLGEAIQIVGDDLLVTNVTRIKKALAEKSCNSLLLKVNQIGTVTEAIDASNLAKSNDWSVVVSHRSGETEDAFISDLVVGLGTGQSKFGATARSERIAKYNQLLRIEEKLNESGSCVFGGKTF
ncbi:MAG: phosphopyruvate hydratase [archaeon]|nr:phosphopyruvate hydratase [archaeon]